MYAVGDAVRTTRNVRADKLNQIYLASVPEGTVGTVTRVATNKVVVRFPNERGDDYSCWVYKDDLEPLDPSKMPRALGTVPEDGIDPNDPKLMWLWDDAAAYAQKYNLCGEYDRMCEALGIPGRKKNHSVSITIAPDVKINGTFLARSKAEAEQMLRDTIRDNKDTVLEAAV